MAGDVNSNIFINIDTSQAMAQLRALEKELTALNRSLIVGTKTATQAQSKFAQSLLHNVNATGQWTASVGRMRTATEQFATALDKSKLSLKDYFRYGVASTKTFGRVFGNEFDTVSKLVEKRVKILQQQYVQLGRDAQGTMNALKFTPKALNYKDITTQLMMATQRQQIFNKLIDDGATKLLNFGKNTQWAGRQLMVGFTVPLMLFSTQAIRSFKEIETQALRFRKVYGDIFTDQGATDQALKNIKNLANEYTKYGLKVSETIKMAADAAAAGFSGKGLQDLVEQTNKLAVLGGVAQDQALETTIALRNAFKVDEGDLKGTIDFLNAVENQTVLALEDVTEAVPRVGPIIKQLGGDVKDLAFFLAAMKEGGVSAAQGANALKSGLASLINPSKKATEASAKLGINLKGIVEENAGNLRNTVVAFAQALKPLTDLQQQRIIEQIFGKYQFARISALLGNITSEGTQAARVLQLTTASAEELAILTQRELKMQADSPMNKFVGAVERLRKAIAPVGELFAKVFTPIIEFVTKVIEKFNNMPESFKKGIAIILGVLGILGPTFLMTFGLIANGLANSAKLVQMLRKGFQKLAYGSSDVALKTQYLTNEELENISVTNALYSKHEQLAAAYRLEQSALASLIGTYSQANIAMGGFAANNPGLFIPGRGPVRKFADGTTSVPGPRGAGDVIPSMLSPGEAVIPAKQSQKYSGFISQIIQDKVPGFATGINPFARTSFSTNFDDLMFGAARGAVQATGGSRTRPLFPVSVPGRSAAGFKSLFGREAKGLSNILYREQGDDLIIQLKDVSFSIPKASKNDLKIALQKNERFLTMGDPTRTAKHGRTSTRKGESWENTTEGKLYYLLKVRSPELQGKKITRLSDIYGRLQKWDTLKNRVGKQSVAEKRWKEILSRNNPNAIRLMNYYESEEKAILQGNLERLRPGISSRLNWDKKDTPSHLTPVGKKRGKASWTEEKIARDWSWFNLGLRGTSIDGVVGAHPLNLQQALQIIRQLDNIPNISDSQLALREALRYRVGRQPKSYYDEFKFTDKDILGLADGILSVPGPKGAGDIQPAMLAPGEAVIPAKQSQKYSPLLQAIANDQVPGFEGPGMGGYTQRPSGIIVPSSAKIDDPWDTPSTVKSSKLEAKIDRAVDKFGTTKIGQKLSNAFDNMAAKANNAATQTDKNATATQTATKSSMGLIRGYDAQEKAQLKNARQLQQMNSAGKMMGLGMATSMLPMIGMAQASQDPNGLFARNMSTLTAVSMASMMAPMLNTPAKLLTAAAVSYGAVLLMQSKQIKKAIQEGRGLAEQFSMTTKKLEEFGTVTGQVSITQEMEQKRLGRTTTIAPVSQEFGETFLSGETGKKFLADFQELSKQYDTAVAAQISVAQLASAVNQGVLTFLQAESVITKMSRDLKNPSLEFKMQGQLLKILGPDGEDITKDPLKVQVELLLANEQTLAASFKNFGQVVKKEIGLSKSEIGGLIGGAGAGALLAQGAYSRSLVAQTAGAARMAPMPLIAIGATVATIATRIYQMGKQSEKIGKAASVVQGISAQNLQAVQQSMDAYNYQYNKQIQILQLEKDRTTNANQIAKINEKINKLEADRAAGMEVLKKKQLDIIANYVSMGKQLSLFSDKTTAENLGQVIDPINLVLNFFESRKAKEKLRESALIGMQKAWGDSFSSKLLGMELEKLNLDTQLTVSLLVESKATTPEAMLVLKKVMEQNGRDINQQINLIVSTGGVDALARIGLITERLGQGDAAQKFEKLLNPVIKSKNKKDLDDILTAVEEYMKFPDTIPLELAFEVTSKKDIERLKTLGKEIKDIKSRFPTGKVSLQTLLKYQQELNGEGVSNTIVNNAINNWKLLETLPPDKRFQAMFSYSFSSNADSFQKDVDTSLQNLFTKQNKEFISGSKENLALLAKLRDQYGVTGSRNAFTVYNEIFQGALKKWKDSPTGLKAAKQIRADIMKEWFGEFFPDSSEDGKNIIDPNANKPDFSWLDDAGQKIKLFGESSFNALQTLNSARKFFPFNQKDPMTIISNADQINEWVKSQEGAIEQIEKLAAAAGLDFSDTLKSTLKGLDPKQFEDALNLMVTRVSKGKYKGRVKALLADFFVINELFSKADTVSYIDGLKSANDALYNQIEAYKILTNVNGVWKLDSVSAMKMLENAAVAADIANGKLFSTEEIESYNRELNRTKNYLFGMSMIELTNNISDIEAQIKAYDILNKQNVKQEVILEIIKNKALAWGIANGQSIDDVVSKTQIYLDLLDKLQKKQETFESKMQGAIDLNVSALDLQARVLQNQFDRENFELKADIKLAQDAVEKVNKQIQDEQDKIDAINLEIKYDPTFGDYVIADLQENINDMQRIVEESYDRPIAALQDRSSILSNDLTLMDRAAEKINEKYDEQAKALEQISQINQDIVNQQKQQIDLADALTRGDISAAAQAANEMRANAAQAATRSSSGILTAAREAEIANLKSASGMTRKQIEQEQFDISQRIYNIELGRKKVQANILVLEDSLYSKQELREDKTLKIRDHEIKIDELRTKDLANAQKRLDDLQAQLDKRQAILDAQLAAIDKQKLSWEATQLALDAYKLALDEINKGELKTMQDMINDIVTKFNSIKGKITGNIPITTDTSVNNTKDDNGDGVIDGNDASVIANATANANAAIAASEVADAIAAEAAAAAAAADAAAEAADAAAQAAADAIAALENDANSLIADLEKKNTAMKNALIKKLTKAGKPIPGYLRNGIGGGDRLSAAFMSSGGMVKPKYFSVGGIARGSDKIPAMLSPGEFIVSKYGVENYGVDKLRSINSGNHGADAVYNYNLSVNVNGANLDANDIARTVITKIKEIDSQRIRGQRVS